MERIEKIKKGAKRNFIFCLAFTIFFGYFFLSALNAGKTDFFSLLLIAIFIFFYLIPNYRAWRFYDNVIKNSDAPEVQDFVSLNDEISKLTLKESRLKYNLRKKFKGNKQERR